MGLNRPWRKLLVDRILRFYALKLVHCPFISSNLKKNYYNTRKLTTNLVLLITAISTPHDISAINLIFNFRVVNAILLQRERPAMHFMQPNALNTAIFREPRYKPPQTSERKAWKLSFNYKNLVQKKVTLVEYESGGDSLGKLLS